MTKPIEVKEIGPNHAESIKSPRDIPTKPIHQFTWENERSYQVVYEVILNGITVRTEKETVAANSYAQAAWRIARIVSPKETLNLLDVIRLS